MADLAPYERLLELVERQADLVARRDWAALAELECEHRRALCALPSRPPADAGPLLRRAEARAQANTAAIAAAMDASRAELTRLVRGRRAVSGYGPPRRPRHLDVRG